MAAPDTSAALDAASLERCMDAADHAYAALEYARGLLREGKPEEAEANARRAARMFREAAAMLPQPGAAEPPASPP